MTNYSIKIIKVKTSGVTKKYSFRTHDGHMVKAVYVQRPEKDIICLSTQVGCIGECKFCSAYGRPLVRSLRAEEMVDMAGLIYRQNKLTDTKLILVSFMGTGEPLANTDNVLGAMKYFHPEIKVAISVSGHDIHRVELIPTYVKVQFTLVSANQYIRDFLQPNVDSLSDLRYAAEHYQGPKEFSIPLIEGYNDGRMAMDQIAEFVKASGNLPVKLNKYNPVNGLSGIKSSKKALGCCRILERCRCQVEYYETDGTDIYAACGQFEVEGK